MKPLLSTLALLIGAGSLPAAEADPVTQVAERAAATYTERLTAATTELNETRRRILREQQPLAEANRKLEDRIAAVEAEISELEARSAQRSERRQQLHRETGNLRNNLNYLTTLSQDTMKTLNDSVLPGESSLVGDQLAVLQQKLETQGRSGDLAGSRELVDLFVARTRQQLGGYTAPGSALIGEDNRLVAGTFAFVGPEAYFRATDGTAGVMRTREGGAVAVAYPVAAWSATGRDALFTGGSGTMPGDPSGGKALRLRQIHGTLWEHIEKGGVVAYAILAVGIVAILLILQKLYDLRANGIDSPRVIEKVVAAARSGSKADLQAAVLPLRRATRDVFQTGIQCAHLPKAILEDHLFARTLQIRLQLEKRLPLLAVIATAAPLMGLLGTVMGMVKTFALITVFGTGNAGKLSGGISEVLVATELGLMVAIPALVAHGFLAHRIQKNLSVLDRYAVEFVTAVEEARSTPAGELVAK